MAKRYINRHLALKGCKLSEGTIVDATLISAPSSTKNREAKRDPEMQGEWRSQREYPRVHQAKKGNQWYFGMKLHIGVDAESGLTHSATGTAGIADFQLLMP